MWVTFTIIINKPVKTLNDESSLLLKPPKSLKLLVNQFNNNASQEDNTDSENVIPLFRITAEA